MFGNWLKTTILMAGIVALFGVVGAAFGGANGMLLALGLGGAMNLFAYWFSDKMVLSIYNAQEVDAASAPQYYCVVRELSQRAGLPMPRVYLIDEAQPNAFATGRNPEHAAVAATSGIQNLFSTHPVTEDRVARLRAMA
jgi:heat shock protein HtpX